MIRHIEEMARKPARILEIISMPFAGNYCPQTQAPPGVLTAGHSKCVLSETPIVPPIVSLFGQARRAAARHPARSRYAPPPAPRRHRRNTGTQHRATVCGASRGSRARQPRLVDRNASTARADTPARSKPAAPRSQQATARRNAAADCAERCDLDLAHLAHADRELDRRATEAGATTGGGHLKTESRRCSLATDFGRARAHAPATWPLEATCTLPEGRSERDCAN